MSDCGCLLPNLGCLSIPIQYITTTGSVGPQGPAGAAGAAGATGATGATGASGVYRLYANVTETSTATTGGSFQPLDSYTLPANTLVNNKDSLIISVWNRQVNMGSIANPQQRRITFGGVSCTAGSSSEPISLNGGKPLYRLIVELIKTSATTATCNVQADYTNSNGTVGNYVDCYQVDLPALNFTTTNVISFAVRQNIANDLLMQSFTIDKITAQ